MKRLKFETHIEIPADTFAGEFDSDPGHLVWHALEHGDAGGDFFSHEVGEITIEDYEETE